MTPRRPIAAAQWWRAAEGTFRVVAEYLGMAKRAELREEGHDCGHTFRIQVTGPLGRRLVEVRAHNLRDALLLAAALPITAWPGLNEPDDEEGLPA